MEPPRSPPRTPAQRPSPYKTPSLVTPGGSNGASGPRLRASIPLMNRGAWGGQGSALAALALLWCCRPLAAQGRW